MLEKSRRHWSQSGKKYNEIKRQRYKKNPEPDRERCRTWYGENLEKARIRGRLKAHKRKLRIKNDHYSVGTDDIYYLLGIFDNRCPLTGSAEVHLDHFIPLNNSKGTNSFSNLIPLDKTLNMSKGAKNPIQWLHELEEVPQEKKDTLMQYLAGINGLTKEEYTEYVYTCFSMN